MPHLKPLCLYRIHKGTHGKLWFVAVSFVGITCMCLMEILKGNVIENNPKMVGELKENTCKSIETINIKHFV